MLFKTPGDVRIFWRKWISEQLLQICYLAGLLFRSVRYKNVEQMPKLKNHSVRVFWEASEDFCLKKWNIKILCFCEAGTFTL